MTAVETSPIPGFTVARVRELGVRRISLGSALARVAWGAVIRGARDLGRRHVRVARERRLVLWLDEVLARPCRGV